MSIINFFNKAVLASIFLFISLISANVINANTNEDQKRITGIWKLKPTTAGKNHQQIKPIFFALPTEFVPESLILAADDNVTEITINEGFKDFIFTQTLPTNGTVVTKYVALTGEISSKAVWIDNKLVIEITTAKGDRIIETFQLSANKRQLIVNVQTTGKNISKTRRIYNRVAEQVEDNTVQIGIVSYPF